MSSENKTPGERKSLPRMDQGVSLQWVRPARQDRSRDTQERLIEAAERLLARGRSWADISVAELVKEAGASVGAFYNRFRDKDALLHVLQIQLNKEGEDVAAQARAVGTAVTIPFEVMIRAFVTLAVTAYREQWGLRRALMVQMCSDKAFRERAIELTDLTCETLTGVLAARYPHNEPDKLRTVVDVAHRMVYGLLDQNLMFSDRATNRVIDDPLLIEELTAAIVIYIRHRVEA